MMWTDARMTRRGALQAGVGGVVSIYLAGCGGGSSGGGGGSGGGSLTWHTWSDHYAKDQLASVERATRIAAKPTLQSDNAEGYLKLKQDAQIDMLSADALWVPKENREGLTSSFDIAEIGASRELYPFAREMPFWRDGGNTMAYPFAWSTVQICYDPRHVSPAPTSWEVLLDKRYQGKVIANNQPTDLMAVGGLATGAADPYNMTPEEIGRARDFLREAKPAFLTLAADDSQIVRALADGSATMAIANLGMDYRVKDAGGPQLEMARPKEGVFGYIDGEQLVKASSKEDVFLRFLDKMERADWIAANFLANSRPLFNEKAYKLLVDQGDQERADRLSYNEPEQALEMTLKGPSGDVQAYTDAFNEVFGA
jgi:spermidine/putrescine transport system substrate-binding protein